jgi:hypothetical protein
MVAVLLMKNVDAMGRTLNMAELHQYLISLLRKMQNTCKALVISRIWQMGIFPKKENFHQT